MFVTIQRGKITPLKEKSEQGCYNAIKTARYLQLGYKSLRLFIVDK
jgi:hypothetical protein